MEAFLKLPEWRCTRSAPYSEGCPGHTDKSSRQGYYIRAATKEEAIDKLAKEYFDDIKRGGHFTADLWKPGIPHVSKTA